MKGILVASDLSTEWMLPWWWSNYSTYNNLPVAIIDFGMSLSAVNFCRKIGIIIDTTFPLLIEPPKKFIQLWQQVYAGDLYTCRKAWMKKPFAMLASPFDTTLWLDLDCQVKGKIDALIHLTGEIALAPEPARSQHMTGNQYSDEIYTLYNSGVVIFKKEKLMEHFVANVMQKSQYFMGDQEILSWTLHRQGYQPQIISPMYNWRPMCGENPHAVIIHHVGAHGKHWIMKNAL